MPLRVTNGIPIRPQFPAPPVTELEPVAATPEGRRLARESVPTAARAGLQRFPQLRDNWCWAACAEMVTTFFERPKSQCELAEILFETTCCGDNGDFNLDCDRACNGSDVADLYGQLDIDAVRATEPIDFSAVVNEIQNRRPVEVGLAWLSGLGTREGGHLVIIVGVSPSEDGDTDGWVRVNDPLDVFQRQGLIRHSELLSAYGRGEWSDTWTELRVV